MKQNMAPFIEGNRLYLIELEFNSVIKVARELIRFTVA